MNQNKNSSQLNTVRDTLNEKVSKYSIVGNSKRVFWNAKRRFRTI